MNKLDFLKKYYNLDYFKPEYLSEEGLPEYFQQPEDVDWVEYLKDNKQGILGNLSKSAAAFAQGNNTSDAVRNIGYAGLNFIPGYGQILSTVLPVTDRLGEGMEKAIANGYKGGIGSTLSNIQSYIPGSKSNLVLTAGVAGLERMFGSKINDENVNKIKNNITNTNNWNTNATTYDSLAYDVANSPMANSISQNQVGKDGSGFFGIGKPKRAKNLYNKLNTQVDIANDRLNNKIFDARAGVANNVNLNMNKNYYNNFALGGNLFENGGDLFNYGLNFDNGLQYINAGSTHENNPYQGVPISINEQDGQPNLVEEGEVIAGGDYVFSNRLTVPDDLARRLGIPRGKTYAEAVKYLSKESEELPNDPIVKRGLQDNIVKLQESQEQLKQEQQEQEQAMQAILSGQYADGGTINIKEANRGLFTKAAKKAGMDTQEYAQHILANKNDYNTQQIRRANFARNAAGWQHANGGHIYDGVTESTNKINPYYTFKNVDGIPSLLDNSGHVFALDAIHKDIDGKWYLNDGSNFYKDPETGIVSNLPASFNGGVIDNYIYNSIIPGFPALNKQLPFTKQPLTNELIANELNKNFVLGLDNSKKALNAATNPYFADELGAENRWNNMSEKERKKALQQIVSNTNGKNFLGQDVIQDFDGNYYVRKNGMLIPAENLKPSDILNPLPTLVEDATGSELAGDIVSFASLFTPNGGWGLASKFGKGINIGNRLGRRYRKNAKKIAEEATEKGNKKIPENVKEIIEEATERQGMPLKDLDSKYQRGEFKQAKKQLQDLYKDRKTIQKQNEAYKKDLNELKKEFGGKRKRATWHTLPYSLTTKKALVGLPSSVLLGKQAYNWIKGDPNKNEPNYNEQKNENEISLQDIGKELYPNDGFDNILDNISSDSLASFGVTPETIPTNNVDTTIKTPKNVIPVHTQRPIKRTTSINNENTLFGNRNFDNIHDLGGHLYSGNSEPTGYTYTDKDAHYDMNRWYNPIDLGDTYDDASWINTGTVRNKAWDNKEPIYWQPYLKDMITNGNDVLLQDYIDRYVGQGAPQELRDKFYDENNNFKPESARSWLNNAMTGTHNFYNLPKNNEDYLDKDSKAWGRAAAMRKMVGNRYKTENGVFIDPTTIGDYDIIDNGILQDFDRKSGIHWTDFTVRAKNTPNQNVSTPTISTTPTQQQEQQKETPKVKREYLPYLDDSLRYVPLGINSASLLYNTRPVDFTSADNYRNYAEQMGTPLSLPLATIGNYRRRNPYDESYTTNMINQTTAANNRQSYDIAGGNRAMQMGSQSARDNINLQQLAQNALASYQANRTDDAQVADFNRATDEANIKYENARNQYIAQLNHDRDLQSKQALINEAIYRQGLKDQRDIAIANDISRLSENLSGLGQETREENILRWLYNNGVLAPTHDILTKTERTARRKKTIKNSKKEVRQNKNKKTKLEDVLNMSYPLVDITPEFLKYK